jgi:hypothetical protein
MLAVRPNQYTTMGINKGIPEQEKQRISNCSHSDFLDILADMKTFGAATEPFHITIPCL